MPSWILSCRTAKLSVWCSEKRGSVEIMKQEVQTFIRQARPGWPVPASLNWNVREESVFLHPPHSAQHMCLHWTWTRSRGSIFLQQPAHRSPRNRQWKVILQEWCWFPLLRRVCVFWNHKFNYQISSLLKRDPPHKLTSSSSSQNYHYCSETNLAWNAMFWVKTTCNSMFWRFWVRP